jgi:hypothetical protein
MDFVITANGAPKKYFDYTFKGSINTYSFDFSPWADDNHDVSSAAWEVIAGNASVSGASLTDNVATAQVTFSDSGGSLIKVTATTATEKYVAYLDVLAKDPMTATNDYWVC